MGAVKKAASSVNEERKRGTSKANEVRKSIHRESIRAVKNPDVWKAAALVAAPYAIGAMGGAGAAGGGFLSTWGSGASAIGGVAKAGLAKAGGGIMSMFGGGGAGAAGAAEAGGGSGLFGSAMKVAKGIGGSLLSKIKDPKYMASMLMRAGKHIGGSKLAGDGMSDEEKKFFAALVDDVGALRSNDQKAFDTQMKSAHELMGMADQYDPHEFGLKAQQNVQIAAGVQENQINKEAAMREGGRGSSAADKRRRGLDVTRAAQSAYMEGKDTGRDMKTKVFAAGAGLVPGSAPTGAVDAAATVADMHDTANKRRTEAVKGTSTAIDEIFSGGRQAVLDSAKDKIKKTVGLG